MILTFDPLTLSIVVDHMVIPILNLSEIKHSAAELLII